MTRGFEVISEFEEMPKQERPKLPERKTIKMVMGILGTLLSWITGS